MNRQPCYHRVTILFTATEEFEHLPLERQLNAILKKSLSGYVGDSLQIEEMDEPEWGDPADLM